MTHKISYNFSWEHKMKSIKFLLIFSILFTTSFLLAKQKQHDFQQYFDEGRKLFSDNGYFWIMDLKPDSALIEGIQKIDQVNYEFSDEVSFEALNKIITKVEQKANPKLLKFYQKLYEGKCRITTRKGKFTIKQIHGQRMEIHGYVNFDELPFEVQDWTSMQEFHKNYLGHEINGPQCIIL